VEGLGKRYRLGAGGSGERYTALRDVVTEKTKSLFRRTNNSITDNELLSETRDFWALKNVSFDVKEGEVIGIVGRNGAGKSTLLKILSRITEPTEGKVRIRGRVASLLEVGTGFHPELTGRENVYLNGAILGMSRAEIKAKFDEIVAFAEIEKFLDTPVKRYSSGMYVRLAFAVAAHLDPEILIVDEVLAVGDAQFQQKCLGKMRDVSRGGRTVLFVSHNMAAMTGMCTSAAWLSEGTLVERGEVTGVIAKYLSAFASNQSGAFRRRTRGDEVAVSNVELLVDGQNSASVQSGASVTFRVRYQNLRDRALDSLSVSILLFADGQKITNLWTNCHRNIPGLPNSLPRTGIFECHIPKWPLRTTKVRLDIFSHIGHVTQDWIEEALVFDSFDGDFYESGITTNPDQGSVLFDHRWSFLCR
jgi:lipopolysaccharide transport system ATP-binding protein